MKTIKTSVAGIFFYAILITIISVCLPSIVNAQGGVGISPSGAPADNSAGLDVSFNNKGLLIPRMTTAQRDAISNPAAGLVIYNTDCNALNYNAGTSSFPNWAVLNSTAVVVAGVNISANPAGAICTGASVTFTATPASGITSATYQWRVNGVNVGTNSATYTTTTLNNGDVVSCELSSSAPCVTGSPAMSNAITMLVNTIPTITGTSPGSICISGAAILGATASSGIINWYEVSSGGSSLGTGTSFTTPSLSSTTNYYADATANGCTTGTRTAVTATVYTTSPAQPGTITGQATSLGGVTGVTYSITAVSLATSYTWTVPSGANIVSGQGTTSITVNFGCSASGNIAVVANNICGSSPSRTLSVSTTLTTPGAITGNTSVCPNAVETYSISPVANAINYTWTVPSDAVINSGQGTTAISVTYGSASGSVTVKVNNCSGASSLSINVATSTFTWEPTTPIFGGVQVTFLPTATYTGATYNWTFQGGNPSSSTAKYPVCAWPTQSSPTSFNVTLSVSGCQSVTNPILVSNTPGQALVANGSGRTGSIQNFTIPGGVTSITIRAYGAQGGSGGSGFAAGGLGASMSGVFSVSSGQVLNILVGQAGSNSSTTSWAGGGGGGTFVVRSGSLLIAAGGGGGGGCLNSNINGTTSTTAANGASAGSGASPGTGGSGGNGGSGGSLLSNGGGYSTDGTSSTVGGKAYVNGGIGGLAGSAGNGGDGGYGGGAGGGGTIADTAGGGGGGGYSGGGGGGCCCIAAGGGGGSFNSGSSQSNLPGVNKGNGQVIITW